MTEPEGRGGAWTEERQARNERGRDERRRRLKAARRRAGNTADPFAALGLPAQPDLTDDEVRAAWRRIAAATHPDRDDGGDPQLFAAAAAAYTELRTPAGRGEAYADLTERRHSFHRIRGGRPAVLAARLAVAGAACVGAVLAAGAQPATYAVIAGATTWLFRTARRELAPAPAGKRPAR